MSAYPKGKQDDKQIMTLDARVPYEPPALTVAGKVEHLTALGGRHSPDFLNLIRGNLI